jgi:hypothetical protein
MKRLFLLASMLIVTGSRAISGTQVASGPSTFLGAFAKTGGKCAGAWEAAPSLRIYFIHQATGVGGWQTHRWHFFAEDGSAGRKKGSLKPVGVVEFEGFDIDACYQIGTERSLLMVVAKSGGSAAFRVLAFAFLGKSVQLVFDYSGAEDWPVIVSAEPPSFLLGAGTRWYESGGSRVKAIDKLKLFRFDGEKVVLDRELSCEEVCSLICPLFQVPR